MRIDFQDIPEEQFPAFKGGEKELYARMFFDGKVRIMQGRLLPGASIGTHTHVDSAEVIFITEGHGRVNMDGQINCINSRRLPLLP